MFLIALKHASQVPLAEKQQLESNESMKAFEKQ
jgi:hypothetical protein